MYKCLVKVLLNSIWQTHATVDLCVSVFSTDMHSSSLGARPGGFDQVDFCADINYLLSVHSTSTITGYSAGNLAKEVGYVSLS